MVNPELGMDRNTIQHDEARMIRCTSPSQLFPPQLLIPCPAEPKEEHSETQNKQPRNTHGTLLHDWDGDDDPRNPYVISRSTWISLTI